MSLFPVDPQSASDWIVAYCDGGSRGNPGPSGFGAVISDATGEPLAELSEFLGVRTNNFAEYSGLLAVLDWAIQNGHARLKVVSDSELMVKQVQGKYKVNSPDLKPLWARARESIARLDAFEISHALRHKNKAADALANEAMDRGMGRAPGLAPERTAGDPGVTRPQVTKPPAPVPPPAALRGFTKNGAIHLLGSQTLPDGVFVKIIPE